jgi:hypothetical protein
MEMFRHFDGWGMLTAMRRFTDFFWHLEGIQGSPHHHGAYELNVNE